MHLKESEPAWPGGFPGTEALREAVRRLFVPARPPIPGRPPAIGVEVEWIPLIADSRRPAPLESSGGGSLLSVLRSVQGECGWSEVRSKEGASFFETPAGGRISFEPGGQLEYSSPPCAGTSSLLRDLDGVSTILSCAAEREGIRLLGRGIDPFNTVDRAELRVDSDRYRRMARHFDRCGPAGRRMMRQTAALHVNLDFGTEPNLQWRVANALAPLLIAIFANSARYAGRDTGFRSFRAQQWRELTAGAGGPATGGDGPAPARARLDADLGLDAELAGAGVPPVDHVRTGDDPADAYHALALEAPAFLLGDGEPVPFAGWVGKVGMEAWHRHLSALFPEVRPRGYLEIRSCDAQSARWYAAPVVFLAGILCDAEALMEAARRLPPSTPGELAAAGRVGLGDPARKELACALFEIALEGAGRLGEDVVDSAAIARAAEFRDRFTVRGLDPASGSAGGP